MVRKWTAVTVIFMIAVALAGCTAAADVARALQVVSRAFQTAQIVEETHRVQPGSSLQIHNSNGDITVRVGGDRDIHIRATKRAFGAQSEIEGTTIRVTTGQLTTIETEHPMSPSRVFVDYEITIPPGIALNGVQTSNGYIRVEGVAGNIVAASSNGSIHLEDVDGYVRASTSNGNINIINCTGVRSGVQTSNGNINVEVHSIEGNVEIRAGNGSITAYLSERLQAEVTMTVSNGHVTADHSSFVIGKSSRRHITGQIGDEARHRILIRTSNGTVTARQISN